MQVQLRKVFTFEAAHHHPHEEGPAGRLHGHSFQVDVRLAGEVDKTTGWLIDFAEIKEAVTPLLKRIDHRYLNEIEGLENPTAENIAMWLNSEIQESLPYEVSIRVNCREIHSPQIETLSPERSGDPVRYGLCFEAAHWLPRTPEGHKCRRLHGHSYRLEVQGSDASSLPGVLEKLFRWVDHRNLNELEGLENPTAEILCDRFWRFLESEGVVPEKMFLSETCESGCYYFG